jgi:hypothetical protein
MTTNALQSFSTSTSVPVARINSSVQQRCSTIATRLTNLAQATGNTTSTGIVNLAKFLVPGQVGFQAVIAIKQPNMLEVVAATGSGVTAQQTIDVFGRRISRAVANPAGAQSLQDSDIVIFQ